MAVTADKVGTYVEIPVTKAINHIDENGLVSFALEITKNPTSNPIGDNSGLEFASKEVGVEKAPKLSVTNRYITDIEKEEYNLETGEILPTTATVAVTYSDNATEDKSVTWDIVKGHGMANDGSFNTAGTYYVNGDMGEYVNATAIYHVTNAPTPDHGGSGSSDKNDFWNNVEDYVDHIDAGEKLVIDATSYNNFPKRIMDAIYDREDIHVIIKTKEFGDIIIPAGKALNGDKNRVFWTFEDLAEIYKANTIEDLEVSTPKENTENSSENTEMINPETGGVITISPSTPALMDESNGVTAPTTGIVIEKETASGPMAWIVVIGIVVIGAIGFIFAKKKEEV